MKVEEHGRENVARPKFQAILHLPSSSTIDLTNNRSDHLLCSTYFLSFLVLKFWICKVFLSNFVYCKTDIICPSNRVNCQNRNRWNRSLWWTETDGSIPTVGWGGSGFWAQTPTETVRCPALILVFQKSKDTLTPFFLVPLIHASMWQGILVKSSDICTSIWRQLWWQPCFSHFLLVKNVKNNGERKRTSCEYERESYPKVVTKWMYKYHFSLVNLHTFFFVFFIHSRDHYLLQTSLWNFPSLVRSSPLSPFWCLLPWWPTNDPLLTTLSPPPSLFLISHSQI